MSDLLNKTAALVDIASVSHNEEQIANVIEDQLRSIGALDVVRIENNVIARTHLGRDKRIVLGGHLDTVPPSGNEHARIEGNRLYGCGADDMKGGLAIMVELISQIASPEVDVTLVFYSCEEIARSESGLLVVEEKSSELLKGDVAILLEPTGGYVEAGCQGVIRARIDIVGERAHTARPWMGVNAIHRLADVIGVIRTRQDHPVVIDGCEYRESMQAVRVEGGVASNVVPDAARLEVSMRFAPNQSVDDASNYLRAILREVLDPEKGDVMEIIDAAPGALPALDNAFLASLVERSQKKPRAKLGWTDVAFFSSRGIPATNFGPGDPELAHSKDEFVTSEDLDVVYSGLAALIS